MRCHAMISLHDRIRDKIISTCSGALLSPICEQKSLLPDNNSRPGEIFLPAWNARQPAALDVTVTFPLQSSLIINASEKSGFALSAAEDRSRNSTPRSVVKLAFNSSGFQNVWRIFRDSS